MRWLVLCVVAIGLVTLLPMKGPNHLELVPFSDIGFAIRHSRRPQALAVIGNALLFGPLGAALLWARFSVWQAVAVGAAFSLLIETAQLGIPGRTSSVDDLLLNTLGVLAGWLVARSFSSEKAAI